MDIAERCRLGESRVEKRSPAAGQVLAQEIVQIRLVDRHLAGGQLGDLLRIYVDAEHLEPSSAKQIA